MRPSALLDILIFYCSVTLVCSIELSDSEETCENHQLSARNDHGPDGRDGSCWNQAEVRVKTKQNCMRAAVVEHSRIDGPDCKTVSSSNLDAYEEIARIAKEDGAKMIVFPEDGILMNTAKLMFPCLEEIPDPDNLAGDYNPCLQPNEFNLDLPILTRLSCLALKYGLYLIANYGTKEKRNSSDVLGQTKEDGNYMMLNTDVVFEPSGKFIKRYRKWNPFTETEIFEKAPKLEHVYFDTDYGRFGVFTCFDMMFKRPAIELVERYHIDTAIFPTWWFDELPLLTAVQFQDGWSATNQVNLLASNILRPFLGSLGSSIFSGNRSVYVAPQNYNDQKQNRGSKILLGTIQTSRSAACSEDFQPKVIEFSSKIQEEKYRHKNYKLHVGDAIQVLNEPFEGSQTVCSGKFCCTVDYALTSQSKSDISNGKIERGKLIVIARDGPRPGFYQWYEQVCAFATLKKPCGSCDDEEILKTLEFDENGLVGFERLSIGTTFDTRYVYPTSGHNLSKLVDRERRRFECVQKESSSTNSDDIVESFNCRLNFVANQTNPEANNLYSFGLYGRVYERDLKQ